MKRSAASFVVLIAVISVSFAQHPPPFGWVLGEWNLQMNGAYAGAGITWRQDSGFLYLMDQGYAGPRAVWKLDPADPTGTIEPERWVFANLGGSPADIPWGICWDRDSGCFWVSQILDGSIYSGCYLLRMAQTDSAWYWRGTPADSWRIDSAPGVYWMAGMAKWQDLGYFLGAGVGTSDTTRFVKFDPYTKTRSGFILCESARHGLALVPADSYYIIGTRLNASYGEWDTTGQLLLSAGSAYGPASLALVFPEHPGPQDTVVFYCIHNDPNNTLRKVSAGLLWGQLKAGQAVAESAPSYTQPLTLRIDPNPCRGVAVIRLLSPLPTPCSLSVCDAAGRCVQSRICNLESAMPLDVRSLPVGAYFVRVSSAGTARTARLVVAR
jgi:hypothetical protein